MRLTVRVALVIAAGIAVFLFFQKSGVPAAALAAALIVAIVYLASINAKRPRKVAFIAAACIVVAGLSNISAGESAPLTTASILAALALLVFASLTSSRAGGRTSPGR